MLVDVDHSMKVMRDETFGPVVGVMKVRDAEEAVRLANDSRYGLSALGLRREARRREAVARRLEVGTANVNDVLVQLPGLRRRRWAAGRTQGSASATASTGSRSSVRPESLVISRFGGKREPLYSRTLDERRQKLIKLTRFFTARDWRRRLREAG
mgnify:CR=1 FL=1